MSRAFSSWTGNPPSSPAIVRPIHWADEARALVTKPGLQRLAYGRGRSYGDVCLNNGGALIPAAGLDRIVAYDRVNGVLTAEAGVTFDQILRLVVPDGWFTPVTPGTRHLTLGGAVANDVHGKEHVSQGTFGRHIERFVLWRSAEGQVECSPTENPELFRATIGGLGLTGLLTDVSFRLRKIPGAMLETENTVGDCLDPAAFHLPGMEYSVAWVDASARGAGIGRGIVNHGRFVAGPAAARRAVLPAPPVFPSGLLNLWSLNALNRLRWTRGSRAARKGRVSYEAFFHPLDRLSGWGRLYGRRGFYQHQSVIPRASGAEPVLELLRVMQSRGGASFVSVLKALGPLESPGLMSFPREGLSLALDLPNAGRRTLDLLDALDQVVVEAGGRLYPAKDARMSPATFCAGYPQWEQFARWIDPAFSSSFWRRVTGL